MSSKKKEERVAGVGRNGGCKSKKKREKNLITQRSKCALCGECRNLCMWKSSLRKKNLLLIFCAMVFRARFFLTSFETRQKLFSLCYCLLMLLLLLLLVYSREAKKKSRREKKKNFCSSVLQKKKIIVQHIVYHVRKRTHIFMKNLYGNSSSSNSIFLHTNSAVYTELHELREKRREF